MRRLVVLSAAGVFLMTFGIAAVALVMNELMHIGTCASGGPYKIARQCPDSVGGLVGIIIAGAFCLVIGIGCYKMRGGPRPGTRGGIRPPDYGMLWWPALFLATGGVFLRHTFAPGQASGTGAVFAFGVCGVLFVLMGLVPLLIMRRHLPEVFFGLPTEAVPADAAPLRRPPPAWTPPPDDPLHRSSAFADSDGGLAEQLATLAALHRRGDLTRAEYAAAKKRLLGDA